MTREEFLENIGNWSNHRYLLYPALEATKHLKLPVLELGCGDGSTPYLRAYCKYNDIELFSYDYNKEWADKYGAVHTDWSMFDAIAAVKYGVVLIDESPGEHRKVSLAKVKAEIIVVHDSEIQGWNSSDYQVRPLFNKFKYVIDLKSDYHGGAWASALSNTIDVTKWKI